MILFRPSVPPGVPTRGQQKAIKNGDSELVKKIFVFLSLIPVSISALCSTKQDFAIKMISSVRI